MARIRMAIAATAACMLSLLWTLAAYALPAESERMIERINDFRRAAGVTPLDGSEDLTRSSVRYARWMLANDYFGHLSSIRADGSFRRLGETIAYHFGSEPAVGMTLTQWKHSPGHRSVLLSRSFRAIGAGAVTGRLDGRRATAWVVQVGGG